MIEKQYPPWGVEVIVDRASRGIIVYRKYQF